MFIQISTDLLHAIAWVESRWRAHVVSRAGAIGYYQIKPSTAKWFGYDPRSLWDPDEAKVVAISYLEWLYDYFDNDTEKAISAYNFGPGNVRAGRYSKHYYYRVLGALWYIQHNLTLPQDNKALETAGLLYELMQTVDEHKDLKFSTKSWWLVIDLWLREE